jgi:hypothetical protein
MLIFFRQPDLDSCEGGAMCVDLKIADNHSVENRLTIAQLASAPAPPPPAYLNRETGKMDDSVAGRTVHVAAGVMEGNLVLDPEDIGIPKQGNWELIGACQDRFCFEHGQKEWLLHIADRWMRPSDFEVREAETKLKIKFQKYQRKPQTFLKSRVDCDRTLWSHLDTPIQQGRYEDQKIYLCRWKFCWTPESDIDDKDWVQTSCRAQDQLTGRRRSARVRQTVAYGTPKFNQMMEVINLEI